MRRGFTLLEILLAVSLFTLIIVGALAYFEGAQHVGGRVEYKTDLYQTARAVLNLMERDLQGIYASGKGLDLGLHGEDSVMAELPTDKIEFVSANNHPRTEEPTERSIDLTRTMYYLDDRGLVRQKLYGLTKTNQVINTTDGETVSAQIVGLDIRYHDGTNWVTTWDSATSQTMPKGIEITLHVKAKYHQKEETETFTSSFWLPVGQTYVAPKQ